MQRPRRLNLKPARSGSVRRLFETYDYCEVHGICAYGRGMFEQGPGRGQLQYSRRCSIPTARMTLPLWSTTCSSARVTSRPPLPPEPHETGFRWGSYDGRRSIRERLPQ